MRARDIAGRFGFQFCAENADELLNPGTDIVFVATRHNSHAQFALRALEAGKNVFVEKPLCVTRAELDNIREAAASAPGHLVVGFNRRFAPLTQAVLDFIESSHAPAVVDIRVNAGAIPRSHWIHDPEIGYGRIIGEVCHFVDLASVLCQSLPVRVSANALLSASDSPLLADNVAVTLSMANGGIASIVYTSLGATSMAKEKIEIFCGGKAAVIDDFRSATLWRAGKSKTLRGYGQDKGQRRMLERFLGSLTRSDPVVPLNALLRVSETSFAIIESIATGAAVDLQ
jgi:polar amino acid transport system substrate-binding protein